MLGSQVTLCSNGITYSFSGGRLGDNLFAYCEARWLSYIHNLDFYYRPFPYSDKLALSKAHPHFDSNDKKTQQFIGYIKDLNLQVDDWLYITAPLILDSTIGWDDPGYHELLKNEICLIDPLPKIEIPENYLSIALHIRRGGGWDLQLAQEDAIVTAGYSPQNPEEYSSLFADKEYPTRFPPDTYYIRALEYMAQLFPERLIYAYIFTDDPNPELIISKYRERINNPRITFDCRKSQNEDEAKKALASYLGLNVLEDFFGMMQFDCIIRAASNFSDLAARIAQPQFEIRPSEYVWEGNKLIIWEFHFRERKPGEANTYGKYVNVD